MKKYAFGIAALVVGVVALGLAIIPGIVMERPLPFVEDKPKKTRPPEPEPKDGVTFKYKDFSITVRGRKSEDNQADGADSPAGEPAPLVQETNIEPDESAAVVPEQPSHRSNITKWLTIAAVSCSLLGLILGPIAWVREKQPALSGSAIAICCLALVWQYVVVGIAVGVGIIVLLLLASHIAS